MSDRSFESVNYLLRPNKNVERKLIAATLQKLTTQFEIDRYRYVGFGSMWFADFVLLHRMLGIDDMVTIESEKSREKRVRFNRPFACIDVKMGHAADWLGEVVTGKRTITWLDYDGPLADATSGDLELAIGAMAIGSLLLTTVNARVDQLNDKFSDDKRLKPIEYLIKLFENTELASVEPRLTRNHFPLLAIELLHERLTSIVLSRKPECEYRPIWSFWYADGSDMITVGGMVADRTAAVALDASGVRTLPYATGQDVFRIELPVLTEKEKRALDRLLPCPQPLDTKKVEFELRPKEVEAYQRFYLQYPVFNENL